MATAKETVRTASIPTRAIALLTSTIVRPEEFIATELASRMILLLINGSALTNRPNCSIVRLGFLSAVRTWKVMSRKVGKETTSPDRSRAISCRIRKLKSLLIGCWFPMPFQLRFNRSLRFTKG